jgi:hypothetical protein
LRGLDESFDYRVTTWPARQDALDRANAGVRGGDELMASGLRLDAHRNDDAARGDFIARLFVLEAG